MDQNFDVTGRKIICCNFPEHTGKKMIEVLVRNEFEVYSLQKLQDLFHAAALYQGIVLLINAADRQDFEKIQEILLQILPEQPSGSIKIIILSPYNNKWKRENIFQVDISADFDTAVSRVLELLTALKARGQRRYVRFGGTDRLDVGFSFTTGGRQYTGKVHDISSAGMSCAFDRQTELDLEVSIDDIKVTLEETTYSIPGRIQLQRWLDEEKRLFIVMFDRKKNRDVHHTIQDFIHASLQKQFSARLPKQG